MSSKLNKNIDHLIETWAARPPALAPINDAVLTPDNERDLLYLYGRLYRPSSRPCRALSPLNGPTDAIHPTRPLVQGVSLQGSDCRSGNKSQRRYPTAASQWRSRKRTTPPQRPIQQRAPPACPKPHPPPYPKLFSLPSRPKRPP